MNADKNEEGRVEIDAEATVYSEGKNAWPTKFSLNEIIGVTQEQVTQGVEDTEKRHGDCFSQAVLESVRQQANYE